MPGTMGAPGDHDRRLGGPWHTRQRAGVTEETHDTESESQWVVGPTHGSPRCPWGSKALTSGPDFRDKIPISQGFAQKITSC